MSSLNVSDQETYSNIDQKSNIQHICSFSVWKVKKINTCFIKNNRAMSLRTLYVQTKFSTRTTLPLLNINLAWRKQRSAVICALLARRNPSLHHLLMYLRVRSALNMIDWKCGRSRARIQAIMWLYWLHCILRGLSSICNQLQTLYCLGLYLSSVQQMEPAGGCSKWRVHWPWSCILRRVFAVWLMGRRDIRDATWTWI